MDRIAETFTRVRGENRAAFIAYICAGDPDFETSVAAADALFESGVDILELGAPFSDPLADGPTNQLAAQRALSAGMCSADVFALVRRIRERWQKPIVIYTYYNLVFARGVEDYVREAREAGVDGLLTLDLPPEEAGELCAASRAANLHNIFIMAPTTPEERMPRIADAASGFIYYVSREGVTGEQESLSSDIGDAMQRIRRHSGLPVVVGFGVSRAEHVRAVAQVADGVVVGSALVNCVAEEPRDASSIANRLRARMRDLIVGLR